MRRAHTHTNKQLSLPDRAAADLPGPTRAARPPGRRSCPSRGAPSAADSAASRRETTCKWSRWSLLGPMTHKPTPQGLQPGSTIMMAAGGVAWCRLCSTRPRARLSARAVTAGPGAPMTSGILALLSPEESRELGGEMLSSLPKHWRRLAREGIRFCAASSAAPRAALTGSPHPPPAHPLSRQRSEAGHDRART